MPGCAGSRPCPALCRWPLRPSGSAQRPERAMNETAPLSAPSPWHAGEVALQKQAGVAERMEQIGRQGLRPQLIEQHRLFYPQLPFVALGAVDADGNAWATLRAGRPGFLQAPNSAALHL